MILIGFVSEPIMVAFSFQLNRYHVPRSWLQPSSNLLVIFEETAGNPLGISVKLLVTETICGLVSESHYPPVRNWSPPDESTSGRISINDTAPEMQLECEDGHVIGSIEFASYGTPKGRCQSFQMGNCHSANSLHLVEEVNNFSSLQLIDMYVCVIMLSNLMNMYAYLSTTIMLRQLCQFAFSCLGPYISKILPI